MSRSDHPGRPPGPGLESPLSRAVAFLLLASILLPGAGCGPIWVQPLTAASRVPAARGIVQLRPRGDRIHLVVKVRYLAPSRTFDPLANVYVVWASPAAGSAPARRNAQNLGVLSVGASRQGMMSAYTWMRSFHLFVTPEPYPDVPTPTGPALLATLVKASPDTTGPSPPSPAAARSR